jgi:hypothetical protein
MKTSTLAGLLAIATLPALTFAVDNPPAKPGPCDRTCLEGYVNRYLDAMQAHKVTDELFARDVVFTENGIRLPFGNEGLWYSMSGKGNYKFYVPDVETQQVAFIGTVREAARGNAQGQLVALALRLKVVNSKITEVEQLAIRPDNTATVSGGARGGGAGGAAPTGGARAGAATPAAPAAPARAGTGELVEQMGKPHEVYFQAIPADKRPTREELIKTANYYFTGLQRNDGKGYYPFTADCVRFENGIDVLAGRPNPQTGQPAARTSCKKQFEESLKGIVSRVRDRRFVAVDRERGIVFAFGFFDHENINWTWQLAELFKIENGEIRRIEAVFHRAPYGIQSGWSTFQQAMSDQPQDVR